MRRARILAGLLLGLALAQGQAKATLLAAWSQYAAGGAVEARIITDSASCPELTLDGRATPMRERTASSAEFTPLICFATLPAGSHAAMVAGRYLPLPVADPRHVVILGDTGCRLKGDIVQSCNDENAWPFHRVALHAAAEHPDLVIHVGDYLYRETPCKEDDPRCKGTPSGDNWPSWDADFFTPGAALLAAAPWVLTRGNHEDCRRAGAGWTALLGRDKVTSRCNPHETPGLISWKNFRLVVLDDSDADDQEAKPKLVAPLRQDLDVILPAKPDWIVTHHPFRGISRYEKSPDGEMALVNSNATLQAAIKGFNETPISLFLCGHIHNFQIENYASPKAPQMVVGEGGDNLDTRVPPLLTGLEVGDGKVLSGMSVPGFGYVVADRIGHSQDWRITVHADDGRIMRHCSLKSRKLSCGK